jgi:hypothetical protein
LELPLSRPVKRMGTSATLTPGEVASTSRSSLKPPEE